MGRKDGYDGIRIVLDILIPYFFKKNGCKEKNTMVIYVGTDKWTLSSAGRATDS